MAVSGVSTGAGSGMVAGMSTSGRLAPGKSAFDQVFEDFEKLALESPIERLKEVGGLGEAAITDLKIVQAAAKRLLRGEIKKRHVLSSWSSVLDYCRTAMAFESKEHFRILFLDKGNHLIADEQQQTGTVDHTPVYPREVVKRALELSATAVILGTTIPLGANNPVGSRSIRLKHWIFDLP